MIEIFVESGDEEDAMWQKCYEQQTVTIGRGIGNDVLLEDPQVSRYHARLCVENNSLVLHNLKSRNGTLVNSQDIDGPKEILVSDAISIGKTTIRARILAKSKNSTNSIQQEKSLAKTSGVSSSKSVEAKHRERKSTAPSGSKVALFSPVKVTQERHSAVIAELTTHLQNFEELFIQGHTKRVLIYGAEKLIIESNKGNEHLQSPLSSESFSEIIHRIQVMNPEDEANKQDPYRPIPCPLRNGIEIVGFGPEVFPPSGLLILQKEKAHSSLAKDELPEEINAFLEASSLLNKTILISSSSKTVSENLIFKLLERKGITNNTALVLNTEPKELSPKAQIVINTKALEAKHTPGSALSGILSSTDCTHLACIAELGANLSTEFVFASSRISTGAIAHIRARSAESSLALLKADISGARPDLNEELIERLVSEAIDLVVQLKEVGNEENGITTELLSIDEVSKEGLTSVFEKENKQNNGFGFKLTAPSFIKELRSAGFNDVASLFE